VHSPPSVAVNQNLGQEEIKIRSNPAAQTMAPLKEVFARK